MTCFPLHYRFAGLLAAIGAGLLSCAAAAQSCAPLEGSAPAIMAGLSQHISDEAPGLATLAPPFGPPQGDMDPKLQAFLGGQRDFAFMTREISEPDLAAFRRGHQGRDPVVLPIAAGAWNRFGYVDAVVVIVNRANPLRSISLRNLDSIFSVSRQRGGAAVTVWRQLGITGALGDQPIRIMGSGAWTQTESARALTIRRHVLSAERGAGIWRAVPDGGSEAEVVERVGSDRAAIGFTGAGHLSAAVRALAVEGVSATPRSAANGRYPLLRTVDLLFDAPGGAADARTAALAAWLLSAKGQAVIARQGDFAPLPKPALRRARRQLAQLGTRPACH